jgi:hypothetical protein
MKKIKIKNTNLIGLIFTITLLLALIIFILKFKSNSYKQSTPEDWEIFVSYLNNIINPVLTLINLIIFIKLTKSVQRASENKSWVDRTESLTFNLIDIASKEVSYLALTIQEMSKKNLDEQDQFIQEKKVIENITIFNNQVTENEFKLRLYVESDIFINCTTRLDFLTSINDLVPKINDFLKVFEIPEPDKRKELAQKFSEIEKCTKKIIENGKKFCDEIYNSL